MSKVFWKPDEKKQIGLAAIEIYRRNDGDTSWKQCVILGQNVLPEDRRRPESSIKTSSKESLDELMQIGEEQYAIAMAEKARVDAERQAEEDRRTAELAEKEARRVEEESSVGFRITKMVDNIVDEFERTLELRLSDAVNKVFGRVQRQIANKIAHMNPTARVPRVLIVGLLPRHEEAIHKDFDPYLDITFVDANKITQLIEKAKHKDYVVVNTGFINHSVVEKLRGHKGMLLAPTNSAVADRLLEIVTRKDNGNG